MVLGKPCERVVGLPEETRPLAWRDLENMMFRERTRHHRPKEQGTPQKTSRTWGADLRRVAGKRI